MGLLESKVWEGCIWLDGSWRSPGGGLFQIAEPGSGMHLGVAGLASVHDVAEATRGAARAQESWGAETSSTRAKVLSDAASILMDARDEVANWLVRESGSIRRRAQAGVVHAADRLRAAAVTAEQMDAEIVFPSDLPGERSFARRVPLGVIGVIAPWNSPLVLAIRALAPALCSGNSVVLKPDPRTPVSGGIVIARVFEEAGLPAGVLQVLAGGAEVGEALISDSVVSKVSFTGSTATGRRVAELAGRHLKAVSLELGGNNAFVVLDDADVEAAAASGAMSSFGHQGQVCMAAGRHLVHEALAESYIDALVSRARTLRVGQPASEDVDLGPLISEAQARHVADIVARSVDLGAVARVGARREGSWYWPTVLDRVDPSMPAFTQEIFGPVAPVTVFADDDEAVRLANDTDYGLVASVFTGDRARGLSLLERLSTGVGHVNDQTVKSDPRAPFGGMGCSGNGARYGALCDVDNFSQWRWLTVRSEGTSPVSQETSQDQGGQPKEKGHDVQMDSHRV